VNIRCLDDNNLVIIGTVMAQTVALDYYAVSVEKMLEAFMKMNRNIEETGNFDQLVSQISSFIIKFYLFEIPFQVYFFAFPLIVFYCCFQIFILEYESILTVLFLN
jgi:hypothetical protein